MRRYAPWALSAALVAALAITIGFTDTNFAPGSSADRTVYSAVYSLKAKNFGRFCSYLEQKFRGPADVCATTNASQWAGGTMLGIDLFAGAEVLADYKIVVSDDTVTYVVQLPALAQYDAQYYRFTVKRQESGKWRITKIVQVESILAEAKKAQAARG